MEQKQIRSFTIDGDSPASGWGELRSSNVEDFLIITDSQVAALTDNWTITAIGDLYEGMVFKGKIDCDIADLNGYKVTVFGRELSEAELAQVLLVDYSIGIGGESYLVIVGGGVENGINKIVYQNYLAISSTATTDETTIASYTFNANALKIGDVITIEGRFDVAKSDENSDRLIRIGTHPGSLLSYILTPSIDIGVKFKFTYALYLDGVTIKAATTLEGSEIYIPKILNDSGYTIISGLNLGFPIAFLINTQSDNGGVGDFVLKYYKITKQS
jgi:hypothetical protein